MSLPSKLDPSQTALLLMDFQTDVLEKFMPAKASAPALARLPALLAAARSAGMRVIHIMTGFRPGYPEISPNNAVFAIVKDHGLLALDAAGTEIVAPAAPTGDEPVIVKHRISAFHDTELESILRASGTTTLLLAGVHTSGVVLSTLRAAFDRDLQIVVARDCCADPDADVHAALLDHIFPAHASVETSGVIIAQLS